MGTVTASGCRGMERYQEMMGWEKPHYFSVSLIELKGEKEIQRVRKHKLCIALFREALKLEDSIGPQERALLGHYARHICQPEKVIGLIRRLAERGYEKKHGHADFSLQVDTEIELLLGKGLEKEREDIVRNAGEFLKEAGKIYAFKDWELRLVLGYACRHGSLEETEGIIKEAAELREIPEERAFYLAGKVEQAQMQEEGFEKPEGMPGYIYARDDFGLSKAGMKNAAWLLHNGALLRRCRDGTRFYRTDPFTADGSYIIPHYYIPVFSSPSRIDHFEIADEKRAEVLAEMYEGNGNMPKELVSEMRQGRSVLKEIRDFQKEREGAFIPMAGKGRKKQEAMNRKRWGSDAGR